MTNNGACVFIDAENINPYSYYRIIGQLKEFSHIKRVQAFADWDSHHPRINCWNQIARKSNYIEKISYPCVVKKNTSDISLTIHAVEMLTNPANQFDVFVLCSADSDFSPLISHMKDKGKLVVGFGGSNCSIGYQKKFDLYFEVKNDFDIKKLKAKFFVGEDNLNSPRYLGAINLIREAVTAYEKPDNTLVRLSDIGLFLKSNYYVGVNDLGFSGSLSDLISLYPNVFTLTSDYRACSLIR